MTNLYGKGKKGKKLWFRSASDTWIELPYGAGQDYSVRALNIWNAKDKKWMIPANGWSVRLRENNLTDNTIESFEVYAPGRSWPGTQDVNTVLPYWNPNYINRQSSSLFSPMHDKWVRLFHLLEKPDPTWRILPLGIRLPDFAPNRTINYNTSSFPEAHLFWPNVSARTTGVTVGFDGVTTPNDSAGAGGNVSLLAMAGVDAHYEPDDFVTPTSGRYNKSTTAGLVDLRAVRARLSDDFPEQNVDYTGQYDDIDDMKVKRVVIHGTVTLTFSVVGLIPTAGIFNAAIARIYAQTYLPTIDSTWTVGTKTYTIGVPGTTTDTGTTIYEKAIASLIFSTTPGSPDSHGNPTYTAQVVNSTSLTYTWENPPEYNVGVYAAIDGLPSNGGALSWTASMTFQPDRVAVQYAIDGHDVPTGKHTWDAIA